MLAQSIIELAKASRNNEGITEAGVLETKLGDCYYMRITAYAEPIDGKNKIQRLVIDGLSDETFIKLVALLDNGVL